MKITVEIRDADAANISRFIELANSSEANTHGERGGRHRGSRR